MLNTLVGSKFVIVALLFSSLSFGQVGTTGSINGTVTDSSGASLPGVKVTVTGTTLIGEETQVTGEQGLYRFPTLPAGVYKVTLEAPGFATQVRDQITINAGFAAEINVSMTVAAQQQSVVVTSEAPLVDTENSNVQNTINRAQMDNLPNSRDVWSMMGVTPGMNLTTIDVGGSAAGSQPAYTAYGYGTAGGGPPASFGNQYMTIDGVNTTEARNGTGMYADYGTLAEYTLSTQGNDASVPTPGVYAASVIKSGGNDLHGTFYFDYENPNFQGHNINTAQLQAGAGTGTRITQYRDINGDFGGPIKKDRLWYYFSLRDQALGNTITGFPANNPGAGPAYTTLLQNITYKLSGQLNKNHRLSHFLTWGRKEVPYRGEASTYYADAVYNQTLLPWASNIAYEGIITPKFFVTVQAGTWGYNWLTSVYNGPNGQIAPRQFEIQDGNYAGSFPPFHEARRRNQFTPAGSYFLDNFLHANHQIKFGYTYEREFFGHKEYGPLNEVVQLYNSPVGSPDFTTPYEVGLLNGPTDEKDYVTHNGAYITDQFRVKRLTVNLGVRWDYWRAYEPQEQVNPSGAFSAFYYAGQALPNGYSIPATAPNYVIPVRQVLRYPFDIAPRIGLAWDLTGKGKTILKMNWGRFYQNPSGDFGSTYVNGVQYVGGIFSAGTDNIGTGFIFKWNNPANAPFNLNQLGAYVSGAPAQGITVQPHIADPVMDDSGIFLEQQLSNTLSIRAGFVYRYLHHDWQQVNTTLTSNLFTQAVQFYDPGPDGVKGTSDDRGNITAYDIPAGVTIPISQFQMQTPAGNNASWVNYEFEVNKRMSRRFMVLGSFYWTGAHLLTNGVPTNPDMAINNYVKDHYWTAHISGTYQARWGILVTPILRMQQGQPTDRVLNVTGLRVGTQSIAIDPFGTYHYQNIYVFDTRLEKQFRIHERFRLGVFFDAFNIFNSNADTTQSATTGTKSVTLSGTKYTTPLFLSPTAVLNPRIFRIGVKFSF